MEVRADKEIRTGNFIPILQVNGKDWIKQVVQSRSLLSVLIKNGFCKVQRLFWVNSEILL